MPKIVDHEAYRAELLERCFRVFARRGYASVTTRELAAAARVSAGTLYHYFENKEAIFEQMLSRFLAEDVSAAIARIGALPAGDRRRALAGFVAEREQRMQDLLLVALDHARQAKTKKARALSARGLEALRTAIRDHLGVDDAEATEVLRSLVGALVHRLLDPAAPAASLPSRTAGPRRAR